MLVHRWDTPIDDDEANAFVAAQGFGHLVAAGLHREVPVIVPTQYVVDGADILAHLARPNPIWAAIAENPMVVLSVAGDWAYIPAAWKAVGDEDPRRGIPTTYYGAVQLTGPASVIDDPEAVAAVLRRQLAALEPGADLVDPREHGAKLGAIRGLRIRPTEVRAKFKYGGNVDVEHRRSIAEHLDRRAGPGDAAAGAHLARRITEEQAR